jgi:hypothetical protein
MSAALSAGFMMMLQKRRPPREPAPTDQRAGRLGGSGRLGLLGSTGLDGGEQRVLLEVRIAAPS